MQALHTTMGPVVKPKVFAMRWALSAGERILESRDSSNSSTSPLVVLMIRMTFGCETSNVVCESASRTDVTTIDSKRERPLIRICCSCSLENNEAVSTLSGNDHRWS